MAKKKQKIEPAPPGEDYPEVMTIDQLSRYLQLHKQVVYRHVQNGHIPASRIGATLRFKKSVIDNWLADAARRSLRGYEKERVPVFSSSPLNLEED